MDNRTRPTTTGVVSNSSRGEKRLIGRVAARLHAAHCDVALDSEHAHTQWLALSQDKRDYWERLARAVVLRFNDDNRWSITP
jgi:hypothetical protein